MNPKTLSHSTDTMKQMFESALVRYKRNDSAGAADTIRNAARTIIKGKFGGNSAVNFYTLPPVKGSIEDAMNAASQGKAYLALQILKHIQLEFHYGRFAA